MYIQVKRAFVQKIENRSKTVTGKIIIIIIIILL